MCIRDRSIFLRDMPKASAPAMFDVIAYVFCMCAFWVTSSNDFNVSMVENDFDAKIKAHALRSKSFVLSSASNGSLPVIETIFLLLLKQSAH